MYIAFTADPELPVRVEELCSDEVVVDAYEAPYRTLIAAV